MPDYYQDHNNVLGAKPRGRAPSGPKPNPVLAGLIVLICVGLVGALAKYGPASGGSSGPGPLAYVLTEFADGQSEAGSGFFFSPNGKLATSKTVAFPQGAAKPPTRYRVFAYGHGNPVEFSATVIDQGSSDDLAGDWAILQVTGAVASLPISGSVAGVAAGAKINIDGFDTSTANVTPQAVADTVREVAGADRVSYSALPKGMDGGPVTDASGAVVGINLYGQNPGGAAGSGWALAVTAVPALQAAAAGQ